MQSSPEMTQTQFETEVENWINRNPWNALLAWRNFWVQYELGFKECDSKAYLESAISGDEIISGPLIRDLSLWIRENYGEGSLVWKDELKSYLLARDGLSTMTPFKEVNGSRTRSRLFSKTLNASAK